MKSSTLVNLITVLPIMSSMAAPTVRRDMTITELTADLAIDQVEDTTYGEIAYTFSVGTTPIEVRAKSPRSVHVF